MSTKTDRTGWYVFRQLRNTEIVAAGYRHLAELVAEALNETDRDLAPGGLVGALFERELARLRNLAAEMDDEADDCRNAILELGYTPEQYEAWNAKR